MDALCSNSADMRWVDMLPTATLGCELGTTTRSVNKILQDIFIMSVREEVDECREKGGVGHLGQLSTARYQPLVVDYLNLPVWCLFVHARKTARR